MKLLLLALVLALCCLTSSVNIEELSFVMEESTAPMEIIGSLEEPSLPLVNSKINFIDEETMSKVNYCFKERRTSHDSPSSSVFDVDYLHSSEHENGVEAPYIKLYDFLSKQDSSDLLILAKCVGKFASRHATEREFGAGYDSGNHVTYITGFAQRIMPAFMRWIRSVAETAAYISDWRPLPSLLGIRCIEIIDYVPGTKLGYHSDSGSIYTMTSLLTHHDDFVGGKFKIKSRELEDGNRSTWTIEMQYLDGLLFDSEASHMVEQITSGTRIVLCIEFWNHQDAMMNRPGYVAQEKLPRLFDHELKWSSVKRMRRDIEYVHPLGKPLRAPVRTGTPPYIEPKLTDEPIVLSPDATAEY